MSHICLHFNENEKLAYRSCHSSTRREANKERNGWRSFDWRRRRGWRMKRRRKRGWTDGANTTHTSAALASFKGQIVWMYADITFREKWNQMRSVGGVIQIHTQRQVNWSFGSFKCLCANTFPVRRSRCDNKEKSNRDWPEMNDVFQQQIKQRNQKLTQLC